MARNTMTGHTSPEDIPTTHPKMEDEVLPNKEKQHGQSDMDNMVVCARMNGPTPTPPIKN
jgi:hypothetical protein